MKKILTFNTKPEAQLVSQLLNEEGIAYTIREHGTSSFPGVFEGTLGYGDLYVAADDQEKVIGFIKHRFPEYVLTSEDSTEKNTVPPVDSNQRKSVIVPVLVVLLIIVSVYTVFLLSSKHKLQTALDGELNTEYSGIWDSDYRVYTTFWTDTKKMRSEDQDEDYDGNYELMVSYDKDGNKVSENYNRDDNATFENGKEFGKDGRLEAEYLDINQDMRIDKYTVHAPDHYSYSYIYNHTSGVCEKVVASDSNGTVINEISFEELGRRIRAESFPHSPAQSNPQ